MNKLVTHSPSLVSLAVDVISCPPQCLSSRDTGESKWCYTMWHTHTCLHRDSWSRLLQECVNTKSAAHTSGSSSSLLQTHIYFLSFQLKTQHTGHMNFITYLAIWRAEIPKPNGFIQRSRNKSIIHWRHWKSNHSAIQKHTCIRDKPKKWMEQHSPQLCTNP